MKRNRTHLITCGTLLVACGANAQNSGITFSIDAQGPTIGIADSCFGAPIDDSDVLTVGEPNPCGLDPAKAGPVVVPNIMLSQVQLCVMDTPAGHSEVDALSYGRDIGAGLRFSVDEWSIGRPGGFAPDVRSEGDLGFQEASADVFTYLGPAGPASGAVAFGNRCFLDGDGLAGGGSFGGAGLGLIEPNPAAVGAPDAGDNLDALDLRTSAQEVQGRVYFSLDAQFVDPLEATAGINTGTAIANGVSGADVLVKFPAAACFAVYAPAGALGLDLVMGWGSDDLDALALWDNGDGVFDPAVDKILFSVRRNSAVIGHMDSRLGVAIEENDILSAPIPGGLSPFPAIVVPGKSLGLYSHKEYGCETCDDLDALDRYRQFIPQDLDEDGVVGAADLAAVLGAWGQGNGAPADFDGDGIVAASDLAQVLGNWGDYEE